ncbi:MAG TPA: hypothetical protein VJ729_12350 [Nitrososphaeraceae archaeon]|nr:hypothetical protein [Nitrososphaeraceae archaeon]
MVVESISHKVIEKQKENQKRNDIFYCNLIEIHLTQQCILQVQNKLLDSVHERYSHDAYCTLSTHDNIFGNSDLSTKLRLIVIRLRVAIIEL